MRKSICALYLFLIIFSNNLSGTDQVYLKGFKRLDCELIPISPLSKSAHFSYGKGKRTLPKMSPKAQSFNWSGYAAFTNKYKPLKGSVSSVSGHWTVPKLSPSHHDAYCTCWVGIDGYSNTTVEQIGTQYEWVNGRQDNFAWIAMYPDHTKEIFDFPVSPKDIICGSVSYTGKTSQGQDEFMLRLINYTKQVYTEHLMSTPPVKRTSAEWIVEAPSTNKILPLAHFSPITFSECIATIKNTSRPIDSKYWKHERIYMLTNEDKPTIKANPSNLFFEGKNFTVTWNHR